MQSLLEYVIVVVHEMKVSVPFYLGPWFKMIMCRYLKNKLKMPT